MSTSNASARWEGGLKEGSGVMKPAHGADTPFSLSTRFEGVKGSNPEEMIGAALAGCFSMALTGALTKAGMSPRSVNTEAVVRLDRDGEGFRISQIALYATADVPAADPQRFAAVAEETKRTCPVSKALAGTAIILEATLA